MREARPGKPKATPWHGRLETAPATHLLAPSDELAPETDSAFD